jgi:diadenosine tetraphosphatase ApaH/serine/threonine PP2A family protein phosphatase
VLLDAAARAAAEWTGDALSPESRLFVESLPVKLHAQNYTLVHGSVRMPIWEYVDDPSVAWDNMELMDTRYCLVGHTHIPRLHVNGNGAEGRARQVGLSGDTVSLKLGDERLILNPGSVGQPRDGDPRAAALMSLLRERYPRSPELAFVRNVSTVATSILHERPTIDFALASVARVLRLPAGSPLTLFALGRTIGWIGHAIEQYATSQIIRPRARYVGPPPA